MSCMVCKKSDVRLFNVGSNYGKINRTVGDDFNEIYGERVKPYLKSDSCVCNICMNILDNVAKLLGCIWNLISDPYTQPQPKFWKIFASLKLEGNEIKEVQNQDTGNRIPTPNLMIPSFSVPYNANLEVQIAERERTRSLSKASTYMGTRSITNSEIQNIFSTKRKTRKRGQKWTKRKGGGNRARSRSLTSSYYNRIPRAEITYTPYSAFSILSSCTVKSSKSKLRSLSSAIRTGTTCTRSVSRAQAKEKEKLINNNNLFCSVKNCNMFSEDIEEMNFHNIEEHEMSGKYYCLECSNKYTTHHLYNLHIKYHSFSFFCLMCGIEQNNCFELQKHLDEHMVYSVPCKYCDKSFLNKSIREEHIRKCHKSRKKRQIYKDKLILDRIDKTNIEEKQEVQVFQKVYNVRVTLQTGMEFEESDTDMSLLEI